MKPTSKSQGIGIFIVRRWSQVKRWLARRGEDMPAHKDMYVCSRYIADPLLIGGKKFELARPAAGGVAPFLTRIGSFLQVRLAHLRAGALVPAAAGLCVPPGLRAFLHFRLHERRLRARQRHGPLDQRGPSKVWWALSGARP